MNIWSKFRKLLPGAPRQIGTVTAINEPAATSTLTLLDGAQIIARGIDVPIGSQAYVRAGTIEGPAPDLPLVVIEV